MNFFRLALIGAFAFSFLWLADYIDASRTRNLLLPLYFCLFSVVVVWVFPNVRKNEKTAKTLTAFYALAALASVAIFVSPLNVNFWIQVIAIGIASLYFRLR